MKQEAIGWMNGQILVHQQADFNKLICYIWRIMAMDEDQEVIDDCISNRINNIVVSAIILHISSAKVDPLSRVVIPVNVRKYLNHEKLSIVEFWLEKKIICARVKKLDQRKLEKYSVTRKLDQLGRVAIPVEFRKILEIEIEDTVSICLGKDDIIRITKPL